MRSFLLDQTRSPEGLGGVRKTSCLFFGCWMIFGAVLGPIGPYRANLLPPWAETKVIYAILDIFDVKQSVMLPNLCPPAPVSTFFCQNEKSSRRLDMQITGPNNS